MRRIQFKAGEQSETVEVTNGDYRRLFKRAEQPFEVADEHAPMLMQTGYFEEAKAERKQPPPPPQNNGGANGNQ